MNCVRKLLYLIIIILVFIAGNISIYKALAQNESYIISTSIDKTNVKPGETFTITLTVKNTGSQPINNFEIRFPFAKTLLETTYEVEHPSYNKILDNLEFPAGFNDRSWLINSFQGGDTKTFKITYKVAESATNTEGILSQYTLPITWIDPAGEESNKRITTNTLRADIYIDKIYKSSTRITLPKLDSISTAISSVKLNQKYLFKGSKTTNLSKINQTNYNSVDNFTLESEDILLEWQKPIDLSSPDAASFLSSLDSYLETSWGKVVYKGNIPFLSNIPVKITFKQARFVFDPKVKIGNDVVDLASLKGSNNISEKTVVVNLDSLTSVILLCDIKSDRAVYETDTQYNEIKVKVSDPHAIVSYTIDGRESNVISIDVNTGEFTIPVQLKEKLSVQLNITAKLKNNESNAKAIIVKYTATETTPTITKTEAPTTVSMLFNQLTLILLLAALGILTIISGVIYYILVNRKKSQLKQSEINFNTITVNKVSSINPSDEHLFPTKRKINHPEQKSEEYLDLMTLRSKYISTENSDQKNEK